MNSNGISQLIESYKDRLGDNDYKFLLRMYGNGYPHDGLNKYTDRLQQINFVGNQNVLDFGSGFGQWAVALSELNDRVVAFEPDELRKSFLEDYVRQKDIVNIETTSNQSFLEEQSDDSFDAIFCYGVIFLTNWKNSLKEFHRILKHDGALYLCTNDIGWYVYVWNTFHNQAKDFNARKMVSKTFADTVLYDSENYFEKGMKVITPKQAMNDYFDSLNFSSITLCDEGTYKHPSARRSSEPFFQGTYAGLCAVYEVYAKK